MKLYNVDQAFEILKANKITSNKESVRRWLRTGEIKGIPPVSKKEGWKLTEEELQAFIQKRLPEFYTTNVAKETNRNNTTIVVKKEMIDSIRSEMWRELMKKNIYEGYIEVKKSLIRECLEHRNYSKKLEEIVWKACENNSRGYKKPRIKYLLEAFSFDRKRMLLDKNFETLEEQIIFPVIEYVRKNH